MYPLLPDQRRFDNRGTNRRADKYKPRSADLQPPKRVVSNIAVAVAAGGSPAFRGEKSATRIRRGQDNPPFDAIGERNSNVWILAHIRINILSHGRIFCRFIHKNQYIVHISYFFHLLYFKIPLFSG